MATDQLRLPGGADGSAERWMPGAPDGRLDKPASQRPAVAAQPVRRPGRSGEDSDAGGPPAGRGARAAAPGKGGEKTRNAATAEVILRYNLTRHRHEIHRIA